MSSTNRILTSCLWMTLAASAFATATKTSSMDEPVNPFDFDPPMPVLIEVEEKPKIEEKPKKLEAHAKKLNFCQTVRIKREKSINSNPDLKPRSLVRLDNSHICFSPEEHLLFAANKEAQIILGPYAPWHIALSKTNTDKAANACTSIKSKEHRNKLDYKRCVESRYNELMKPYDDRYLRDAQGYINRRKNIARRLLAQCNMALNAKRPLLPKDLTLPAALYDRHLNSIPTWMLEEGLLDNTWLDKKGIIKVKDLMQAALGSDCPGNMVLWATYQAPDFEK
ncbi:MAG: hypothetical protein QS748_10105 [Candidatus Endonucleobacter bathymodioli]|uniref:Uncharacterized protein n=1 Tax=Candidatus Endonucleibacter bathymodioli TaxID=539814 RepID=A0AA90NLW8_9GAMM|nr:hypothetical protein [Candidatus Endonucleobacter bathymodioli]